MLCQCPELHSCSLELNWCDPLSSDHLWQVSSQKHLTPSQAHDCPWSTCYPCCYSLHPAPAAGGWAAQTPSPGSGHQLKAATLLGGGCFKRLIHPDWYSCGTSARGLHLLQTGARTAGAVSKLLCTKIALTPASPAASRVLAGALVAVLHQHIYMMPLLPTGPACSEQQLQAPDAAAKRIWSSILQSIQQINLWEGVPSPQRFCCSQERNGSEIQAVGYSLDLRSSKPLCILSARSAAGYTPLVQQDRERSRQQLGCLCILPQSIQLAFPVQLLFFTPAGFFHPASLQGFTPRRNRSWETTWS